MVAQYLGGEREGEADAAGFLAGNAAVPDTDPIAAEALVFNLEASLRVYTHHHFFAWSQGLLQNLIRHEVLICVMRNGDNGLYQGDSFSIAQADSKLFGRLYQQEAALMGKLVKEWESRQFQPLVLDAGKDAMFAGSALAAELVRVGAGTIIAHGTFDSRGRMASFFVFGCHEKDFDPAQAHRVEMLVPSLHAAWMRTKVRLSAKAGETSAQPGERNLLTLRELEVLRWVYLGKSNIEIGLILGISPLTVKNHVQEILRRLNVQNRTQAVGKAFSLHILSN